MFEKKKDATQATDGALEQAVETVTAEDIPPDSQPVVDYGVYNDAIVHTEQSDVVITIPIGESVVTIRAPQALIAQNATDNIAGRLLK